MALASAIVQPVVSKADEVAKTLSGISGVTVHTTTPSQIIIVIEADSLDEVTALATKLEQLENVLGVYPVYIANEEEEG